MRASGVGVRLEDDILVTREGSEVLSDALPIGAAEVERWVAGQSGPAHG